MIFTGSHHQIILTIEGKRRYTFFQHGLTDRAAQITDPFIMYQRMLILIAFKYLLYIISVISFDLFFTILRGIVSIEGGIFFKPGIYVLQDLCRIGGIVHCSVKIRNF